MNVVWKFRKLIPETIEERLEIPNFSDITAAVSQLANSFSCSYSAGRHTAAVKQHQNLRMAYYQDDLDGFLKVILTAGWKVTLVK